MTQQQRQQARSASARYRSALTPEQMALALEKRRERIRLAPKKQPTDEQREKQRLWSAQYRRRHPDRVNAMNKVSNARHAEAKRMDAKLHPEKGLQRSRLYRQRHPDRVKATAAVRRKRHAALYAYHASLRKCRQMQATPRWANLDAIKDVYRNCPKGSHVDHAVPLAAKTVCGLHVEWNLNYLTASANMSKGARWNP